MASDKVSYEPADGIADGKEYGQLRENFLSPAEALESDAANSLANLDGTISTALTNKTNVFA